MNQRLISLFVISFLCIAISLEAGNLQVATHSSNLRQFNSIKQNSLLFHDVSNKVNTVFKLSEIDISKCAKNDVLNVQKAKVFTNASLVPISLYQRPEGTYPYTVMGSSAGTDAGASYSYQAVAGSAFSKPWIFRNLSSNATSYSWDWGSDVNYSTETNASFSIDNMSFLVKGYYYVPLLNSINGSDTSYYSLADLQWEDGIYPSRMSASGDIAYLGLADYWGNTAEQNSSGISFWIYADPYGTSLDSKYDGYVFGSCRREFDEVDATTIANTRTNEVVVAYEKPMSPLVIKDLTYLITSEISSPIAQNVNLQLDLVKIDSEGKITSDTIASSTIYSTDLVAQGNGLFYMPVYFYDTDPETGREMQVSVRVEDEFAIILSGLQQDGINMGIFSDYGNKTDNSSYFGKINEDTGEFYGYYGASDANGLNVYLSLNAYFDYLYTDEISRTLFVGKDGGFAVDSLGQDGGFVYSFFKDVTDSITGEDLIWIDENEIPDWISVSYDNSYYDEYEGLLFYFEASALPEGVNYRRADINIKSLGAQTTITVLQSLHSGINDVQNSDFKLNQTASGYSVNCGNLVENIVLYDITGKLIQSYNSVSNKQIQIDLPAKGIYLLKIAGEVERNIKLIR